MAELLSRNKHEAELRAIVRRMTKPLKEELAAYMKTAKYLSDVPQEFWDRARAVIQQNDELSALLLIMFTKTAEQHVPGINVNDAGNAYVTKRLRSIAPSYVQWSRRMAADAIRGMRQSGGATAGGIKYAVNRIFGKHRADVIGNTEGNLSMINGGEAAIRKAKIEVIRIWAHSRLRPSGHSNAATKPCPICSPREGKAEDEWGGYEPGHGHPGCDCLVLHLDRYGNVIGDDGTFSDTLERFRDRLPAGWLREKE